MDTKDTTQKGDAVETLLQPAEIRTEHRNCDIGLVANYADTDETRFLLTPEACGMLTELGLPISMESGAGVDISFDDEAYAERGVKIVSRSEALKASVVVSYAPLRAQDLHQMKIGATLLCIMDSTLFDPMVIHSLLERKITLGCLDNMYSMNDDPVFANIIDEIDGRAAIMYAQENLSYLGGGKGVLLSGVAGINPCEVLIIGDGTDVYSAATAALNAGAQVTVFNNDISALNQASQVCGPKLLTLALHPKVLRNKVRTADVILLGTTTRNYDIPSDIKHEAKDSAFVLNFKESHPSVSVPRTVAMAISNALVNFFTEMTIKDDMDGMIATTEGVQSGIVTYRGKLVDKLVGSYLSMPCVDISVMLTGAN